MHRQISALKPQKLGKRFLETILRMLPLWRAVDTLGKISSTSRILCVREQSSGIPALNLAEPWDGWFTVDKPFLFANHKKKWFTKTLLIKDDLWLLWVFSPNK
jgi:hypothetical protein